MTDYTQQLIPPDYRNLVINPSAEDAPAATWFSSNGNVTVGPATGVAPVSGAGVATYTVTQQTSLPYYFAPFGPNEPVHRNAFKIPSGRTLSGSVQVRSPTTVWVSLQAQFYVWNGLALNPMATRDINSAIVSASTTFTASDTGLDPTNPAVFNTVASTGALDPLNASVFVVSDSTSTGGTVTASSGAVAVTGGAAWQKIVAFGDASTIPDGATHWSLLISVSGSDPVGLVGSPPALGTIVYADQALVTDSGADVVGVGYFDGSTAGAYWEGDANYSTSRTGTLLVSPADDAPPSAADSARGLGLVEPPDVIDIVPTPISPEAYLPTVYGPREPTTVEVAREIMSWKYTNPDFCLKSDIQLANLRLNSIDDDGVMWVVSDVDGWWTMPEPDVPDIPRGWFDGSYETRGRFSSRVFTITGSFFPTHPSSVPAARDRLIRAMNLCHKGDWFMTHEDATVARSDTKGSKVWLSGQPLISTVNMNGRTDFSIGLRAPDPIKYKLVDGVPPGYQKLVLHTFRTVNLPGRKYPRKYPRWSYPETVFGLTDVTAINSGNATVWPTLTLKGPTHGPVVVTNVDTDQRLRVAQKLNASEELVINCFTKEVTLNGDGNYRFYLDIGVDWLMLQPGPNRMFFEEEVVTSQSTELEVLWRSGWIG